MSGRCPQSDALERLREPHPEVRLDERRQPEPGPAEPARGRHRVEEAREPPAVLAAAGSGRRSPRRAAPSRARRRAPRRAAPDRPRADRRRSPRLRVETCSRQTRSRYTWKQFDSVSSAITGSARRPPRRARRARQRRRRASGRRRCGGGVIRSADSSRRGERRRDLARDGRVPLEQREVRPRAPAPASRARRPRAGTA